jgi:hypothetical protein
MPEGTGFRALYSADAHRQIDAFLAGLTAAHGTPLIDARTWVDDDGFFDLHHLLPKGAAVFTRRLGREAILPLLRGSSLRADESLGGRPPVPTQQARRAPEQPQGKRRTCLPIPNDIPAEDQREWTRATTGDP